MAETSKKNSEKRCFSSSVSPAFTIVELLVVIVVIAVLAAITIVSYSGVSNKARIATLSSDLNQANKSLQSYKEITSSDETYPSLLATANIKTSNNIDYTYNSNSTDYCLEGTTDGVTQSITGGNQSIVSKPCTENGLVGWWKMNGNATDSSGNNNNGTVYGAALTTGENGSSNSAYSFDGVDDYIDVGSSRSVSSWSVNFTVSLWIFAQGQGGVIRRGEWGSSGSPNNYLLQVVDTNQLRVRLWTTGEVGTNFYFSVSDLQNHWRLLTYTYNGINVKIFYEGLLISTIPYNSLILTGQNTIIGEYPGGGTQFFNGSIDDVRIYDRALSANEIQQIYTAGAQ